MGERVHPGREAGLDDPACRSATRQIPSRSARTATSSPTTPRPGRSSSSTAQATSCTATTRRLGPGCSTTPRSRNCCPAASLWSTTITTTGWSRSTRPPGRWYGSTASPAGPVPARQAAHPRRFRPAVAERIDAHPPGNRIGKCAGRSPSARSPTRRSSSRPACPSSAADGRDVIQPAGARPPGATTS